jgi:hypothetical protein
MWPAASAPQVTRGLTPIPAEPRIVMPQIVMPQILMLRTSGVLRPSAPPRTLVLP